jgi:hypothetical protein
MLAPPHRALDFAASAIAADRCVDPGCDTAGTLAELDALTRHARLLAGPNADAGARVAAVRTVLYCAGPWNDHRPSATTMTATGASAPS